MIQRLSRAYVSEGKIRLSVTTWLRNSEAQMGLESVADTTLHLTIDEAQKMITELKTAVYDYMEEGK